MTSSGYVYFPSRTDAQKRDDEPKNVRAEIVRLSGKLPIDDPLRVCIACCRIKELGSD